MPVCVHRRSRCERGRTQRGVHGAVLRAGARERVPRAGAPGRFRRRQVQSLPLMHILTHFTNTTYWPVLKIAYCFTAETRLDSHPLIVITIP